MLKKLKNLTLSTTALLLAVAVVFILNYVAVKLPLRHDLTDEKEFTLSPATKKILGTLTDRLTIKLYYSKDLPPQLTEIRDNVADTLAEFKAAAVKPVTIEDADPDSSELKEQETIALGITPLQLNVIEKDKRELKKAYMGLALYYQDRKAVIPVLAQVENLEYDLALQVLKLSQKDLPKVGVILPADDAKFGLLLQVLQELVEPVAMTANDKTLTTQKINTLLIVAPQDLAPDFSKSLDTLLANGTNVMVFAGRTAVSDTLTPSNLTTGLEDWLSGKGIDISAKVLLDTHQNAQAGFQAGMMQVYVPYPFWVKAHGVDLNEQHPITAHLEEVLLPWTNVIQSSAEESAWTLTSLISSSRTSFLQEDGKTDVGPQYIDSMTTLPALASYPLAVVLENKNEKTFGKVFLTANSNLLQDNFLQQAPANAVFFQNAVEYASWGENLIGIRSRGQTARPLADISESAKTWIKWGNIVGAPAVAIFLGLIFLLVAKKKRDVLIREILS